YAMLFALRLGLGLAVAPSFPCATQTIHRVLPFKDRARGIGLLYMGNSLGSAACAPLAVIFESVYGWREAFLWVAVLGVAWIPAWILLAFTGRARGTLDEPSISLNIAPVRTDGFEEGPGLSAYKLTRIPGVLRGSMVVAAAAPVTTVMLLWGSKYLV